MHFQSIFPLTAVVSIFFPLAYCHSKTQPNLLAQSFDRQLPEDQIRNTREVDEDEKKELEVAFKKYVATIDEQEREAAKTGTIEVNVYWTVFKDSTGNGELDESTITKQIQVLNDAFSGVSPSYEECGFTYDQSNIVSTPFRFNLIDITEITDEEAFNIDFFSAIDKRIELRRGTCSDLNIFSGAMCCFFPGESFPAGIASFPFDCNLPNQDDSVSIDYRTLPDVGDPPYNEGDALVQEVGHWLGLFNTYEGGCRGRDYVADTPPQSFRTFGCPVNKNTCGGSGRDPIHNFMDASDDCCRYHFTNGQVVRMILQVGMYRGLNTTNVTLPEVTLPTCAFPDDGFNYSGCMIDNPCWVGDGFCDEDIISGYNTSECNLDGRDCTCDFPNDGFDYSNCDVELPCLVGDGWCNGYYNDEYASAECNNDGGDCEQCDFPNDGFDYSSCGVNNICLIGDGFCDSGEYDTLECNRDGRDCRFFSALFTYIIALIQLPLLVCWCYCIYFSFILDSCLSELFPENLVSSLVGNFEFPIE